MVSVAQGVSAALRGFPVKLVMMTEDKLDFFIMTKPDIRSVADLKGKVVGISYPGSTTHLVAESILRHFNLEPGGMSVCSPRVIIKPGWSLWKPAA